MRTSHNEVVKKPWHRFDLRTLLAAMAGVAVISFIASFFISIDLSPNPVRLAVLILPWGVGSFVGIAIAAKRNRSTLAGGVVGGVVSVTICPGLLILYLYVNQMNGVQSLWAICQLQALAACGSGLLAALIGILREGITASPIHARR